LKPETTHPKQVLLYLSQPLVTFVVPLVAVPFVPFAGLVELLFVELLFVELPGFVEFPLVEFVLFPPLVELPVLLVVVLVFVELPPPV
jgi:hypothetical protein